MPARRIIAIGASEGGIQALVELVSRLPPDLSAALLIVLHIDAHPSSLPALLARHTSMQVSHGQSGMIILDSHIYIAPPDFHMLVEGAVIRLWRGPKEHHTRPAVDPLFRSAAETWGRKMLGVILTGNLNDGTLGLQEIKRAGGATIAQDPEDAQARGMPTSAIQAAVVDVVLPLNQIPAILQRWAAGNVEETNPAAWQASVMRNPTDPAATDPEMSDRSPFVCPTCRGSLARSEDGASLECYTGHRFTLETFAKSQSDAADDALWSAYRALREKEMVLKLLSSRAEAQSDLVAAANFERERSRVAECAEEMLDLTVALPGTFSQLSA